MSQVWLLGWAAQVTDFYVAFSSTRAPCQLELHIFTQQMKDQARAGQQWFGRLIMSPGSQGASIHDATFTSFVIA